LTAVIEVSAHFLLTPDFFFLGSNIGEPNSPTPPFVRSMSYHLFCHFAHVCLVTFDLGVVKRRPQTQPKTFWFLSRSFALLFPSLISVVYFFLLPNICSQRTFVFQTFSPDSQNCIFPQFEIGSAVAPTPWISLDRNPCAKEIFISRLTQISFLCLDASFLPPRNFFRFDLSGSLSSWHLATFNISRFVSLSSLLCFILLDLPHSSLFSLKVSQLLAPS